MLRGTPVTPGERSAGGWSCASETNEASDATTRMAVQTSYTFPLGHRC